MLKKLEQEYTDSDVLNNDNALLAKEHDDVIFLCI